MIDAFGKTLSFKSTIKSDDTAKNFRPPGTLLETYSRRGRNYEIWSAELTDPAVQLLLERMQIFISFFIEAGTPIPLKDHEWSTARWRVFFLYVRTSCEFTIHVFAEQDLAMKIYHNLQHLLHLPMPLLATRRRTNSSLTSMQIPSMGKQTPTSSSLQPKAYR